MALGGISRRVQGNVCGETDSHIRYPSMLPLSAYHIRCTPVTALCQLGQCLLVVSCHQQFALWRSRLCRLVCKLRYVRCSLLKLGPNPFELGEGLSARVAAAPINVSQSRSQMHEEGVVGCERYARFIFDSSPSIELTLSPW
jgi:hypothetical protein